MDERTDIEAKSEARRQALLAIENGLTIADYEEVLADKRRLVRDLDCALHGEGNTAKQASLCDLIEPARALKTRADALQAEVERLRGVVAQIATGRVPTTRVYFNWHDRYQALREFARAALQPQEAR
jgi:hypothetical protein